MTQTTKQTPEEKAEWLCLPLLGSVVRLNVNVSFSRTVFMD